MNRLTVRAIYLAAVVVCLGLAQQTKEYIRLNGRIVAIETTAPASLTTTPESLSFASADTTAKSVTVTPNGANLAWNASSNDASTLEITPATGIGPGSINIRPISANPTGQTRTWTVTIASNPIGQFASRTISVSQQPGASTQDFVVSTTSLAFPSVLDGPLYIEVSTPATVTWSISISGDSNVALPALSGTGSGSVQVSWAGNNASATARSATLQFSASNGGRATVSIQQQGSSGGLVISGASSKTASGYCGGSDSFQVSVSDAAATLIPSVSGDFISAVSVTPGPSTQRTISYSVAANSGPTAREATIRLQGSSPSGSATFDYTYNQPKGPALVATPQLLSFPGTSGSLALSLAADPVASVSVLSKPTWVTSVTGSYPSFIVSASQNNDGATRSGYIVFQLGGCVQKSLAIPVSQSASGGTPTIAISPSGLSTVPPSGGLVNVTVTSNAATTGWVLFRTGADDMFLNISGVGVRTDGTKICGPRGSSLSFSVGPNSSDTREALLYGFAISVPWTTAGACPIGDQRAPSEYLTIRQTTSLVQCQITLTPNEHVVNHLAHSPLLTQVTINSGVLWSSSAGLGAIFFGPLGSGIGTGSGPLQMHVFENATANPRSGSMAVRPGSGFCAGVDTVEKHVFIHQAGKPPDQLPVLQSISFLDPTLSNGARGTFAARVNDSQNGPAVARFDLGIGSGNLWGGGTGDCYLSHDAGAFYLYNSGVRIGPVSALNPRIENAQCYLQY